MTQSTVLLGSFVWTLWISWGERASELAILKRSTNKLRIVEIDRPKSGNKFCFQPPSSHICELKHFWVKFFFIDDGAAFFLKLRCVTHQSCAVFFVRRSPKVSWTTFCSPRARRIAINNNLGVEKMPQTINVDFASAVALARERAPIEGRSLKSQFSH